MKILIVDDEQLARQRLRHMLSSSDEHTIVGEAANGEQALILAQNHKPDLVFMDIRMPGMDGIEAANYLSHLESSPAIVFTTAFSEHALSAFESNAVGYLLKPIKQEQLDAAIKSAVRLNRAQITQLKNAENSNARTKICVKIRGTLELVPIEDIIYFKADQKYITLRTDDHEYLIEESLKALEIEFENRFLRIHRNALVSETFINGLQKNTQGQVCLSFNHIDDLLEVSRRHLPMVRKILKTTSS
ncbi:MAG: LytTR family DNA-binding domain-containing protein [Gammaproteobacteria bacterium]|nr:LytTR family DNA-binding domain-containing protein [Gammaproteobacteria bacterium]